MPSLREISSSVRGAWLLFVMDPRGMTQFNISANGFWNSFFAAVILAPVYFFVLLAQYKLNREVQQIAQEQQAANPTLPELPPIPDLSDYLLAQGIAYVALWAIFPIVMLWVTRLIRIPNKYVPFVVAYNWSAIVVLTIQLPPFALFYFGLVGIVGAIAPLLSILLVIMIYRWYVAYTALGLPAIACLGIVTLDFVINIFIQIGASALLSA